jgi:hypothetical protein
MGQCLMCGGRVDLYSEGLQLGGGPRVYCKAGALNIAGGNYPHH